MRITNTYHFQHQMLYIWCLTGLQKFSILGKKRPFAARIKEHLNNIGKPEMKLNKFMQYSKNYIFLILKECNNYNDRKRLERKLIKTLNPDLNKFKKNRNENIKIKGDLLNLNIYQKKEGKCYCLNDFTQQEGNHIINFITGEHDITNWRTLYRKLKHKELYLNNEKVSINKLEKRLNVEHWK